MLTPKDIDQKVFKRSLRGYDVEDVERFLQEIATGYQELYLENQAAKERVSMLSDAVKHYKGIEDSLEKALTVAEEKANKRAAEILQNAEVRAENIVADAVAELAKINYQYEEMKRNVEVLRAKVVSLLNAQLDIIKEYGDLQEEAAPVQEGGAVEEVLAEDMLTEASPLACVPTEEKAFFDTTPIPSVKNPSEQTTVELPPLVKNEDGEYAAKDE